MPVALGIDFEDITHTPAYRSLDDPSSIEIDLPEITDQLLSLFDDFNVKATFFVVSEIAETHPEIIGEIANAGHEIASHTETHCSLVSASPERCRKETEDSKHTLEAVTEAEVTGFRAPTCQIDDRVYETLLETGYQYSSSVMNSLPIPGFYSTTYDFDGPTTVYSEEHSLTEVPLSVTPRGRLPISGAWIRLLGRRFFLRSVESLVSRSSPVVTYSHPWEFTDQRRTKLPFRCRVRTGEWLFKTYRELLDSECEFCTVSELANRTTPTEEYTVGRDHSR